ncbi:DUF6153 family protein [Streptomyces sp. NPDC002490]|uniref:DUF6153 family protein n=1 Tax=Streptomyces sp. NPDC002490 TaxID=3154416 RepID=UPI003329C37E
MRTDHVRASRTLRAAGAWGHLLLVTVLVLGVFMMHTVGHPDTPSDNASGARTGHAAAVSTPGTAVVASVAAFPAADAGNAPSGHGEDSSHGSGAAMDLISLCVAVLGAFVLLALLRAALHGRREWLVRLRAGALRTLLPLPPPRGPDLAQLSILRI